MPQKVRWGVLGAAKIARTKVIPAMQKCELGEITAIASRDIAKAQAAAEEHGIGKAYGSYEELIEDPDIDAIYNPLPNHLHVPWSIEAARAGKHVLCEKPIALDVAETLDLIAARDTTGVKIGEAFMVDVHPQWVRAKDLIIDGEIGSLQTMNCIFSYRNIDPANVRNQLMLGGGALMDIGCYAIHCARMMFVNEPRRASAIIERHPDFGTDALISGTLDFSPGQAAFTCSTRMQPFQRMIFIGEFGHIEIEIPVNAPPDAETRIFVTRMSRTRIETFPVCDQYTLQGDAFSKAILEDGDVPVRLEDSLANMIVIEALFKSAKSGRWESMVTPARRLG